ncbi:MAG: BamA/TamA family outer membrane protein [Deltaproteobacteria bacterium]|nr:BamA/TamA family outer membrane protein [Deltaproteobacteria bacterium]
MRVAVVLAFVVLATAPEAWAEPEKPVVGFRVRGDTKTSERTVRFLSHVDLGESVGPDDIPRIQEALLSSELFKTVAVSLEEAPGGVLVVATVNDKHSWIIAPAVFLLPDRRSFGVGFAENNLGGQNQKLLLYGQLGDRESQFFGTYLDPSVQGTPFTYRFDLYLYRRIASEYLNPTADPTNKTIARESTATFLGGGALVGFRLAWWLIADLRLRGARLRFTDSQAPDGTPLPSPEADGWDVSSQARLTLDARHYRYGVRWGPYVQLLLETSIPGLDDYDYSVALLRAYYSWRLLEEHQLELRTIGHVGRHLPFHEELTLGGVTDLRGYAVDRFRGDVRTLFRVEYSVPIVKWRFLAFRAIGFWDTGYSGLHFPTPRATRDYLPGHGDGTGWWRNDVGAGIRIYVKAIVLPLLGLDVAYGIEGKSPAVYFQLGLTDF